MEGKAAAREKLECPSIPTLERKLANLTRQRPAIGPIPRSAVLGKLAAFLPQMATENARLLQEMQDRPATEFDIEHIDEGDEDTPYIEMDLACGILDLRDDAALQAAERAMNGAGGMASTSDSESDSDSDDSTSDSDDDEDEAEQELNGMEGFADPHASDRRINTASPLTKPGNGQGLTSGSLRRGGTGGQGGEPAGAGVASEQGATMAPATSDRRRRKVSAARSKMIEELS